MGFKFETAHFRVLTVCCSFVFDVCRQVRSTMSSVFRRRVGEPIEVSVLWNLREQVRDVAEWLDHPKNAAIVRGSTLDIGFTSRLGKQVAVQGEVIAVSFMARLVALDIELWLSIYPPLVDFSDCEIAATERGGNDGTS